MLLLLQWSVIMHAQLSTTGYVADTSLEKIYRDAVTFQQAGDLPSALNKAEQALQLSMAQEEQAFELQVLELIGDLYGSMGKSATAIPYYLRSAGILETGKDTLHLLRLYPKIAEAYHAEAVFSSQKEYYEKTLELLPGGMNDEKLKLKARIGTAAFHGENYDLAAGIFRELLPSYPDGSGESLNIRKEQITTFDAEGRYDSALVHSKILLSYYDQGNPGREQVELLNNIGYYQTLLGDYRNASSSYLAAIEAGETAGIPEQELGQMHTNAGICFTNMGREKDAIYHFNTALGIFEENPNERSRTENLLANVYHALGDLYNAGLFSRRAIGSSREASNPWMEAQGCRTYSAVLRDGNDPVNALEYYEKYLSIRDSLELDRRLRIESLQNRKNMLEQQERALRLRLKEDEVSELAIQQLRLENERVAQEKAILMQQRSLDMLKQDSLDQAATIASQKLSVAMKERENAQLEQEKAMTEMKLRDEEMAKKAAEREKEMSDQKARLAELETERQKADKKAVIGIAIATGIISILILISLISSRRKKLQLARQKKEIEQKNTDLEQKNEEISAQRDEIEAQRNLVYDQKQAIEAYNDEILKSIEYAQRLQESALPAMTLLQEKVQEHFVLFKPRDVVSGDFYWFAEVEDKMVITVADCTGHGVPGAFMSMMGMSLLKEIVQKEYITHPGVILRRMRKEIINAMGQKGVTGEQRDGMDMALITYDPGGQKIDYAGAYNSLYLVRRKELPAPVLEDGEMEPDQVHDSHCLYEVPADKMPVAHFDRMDKFRNHELPVHPGDVVYMFSDGYADQFGGEKGKKFMYKPFKRLLLKYSQRPLKEQYEILSQTLDEWMGDIEQVDDICVMGLRL